MTQPRLRRVRTSVQGRAVFVQYCRRVVHSKLAKLLKDKGEDTGTYLVIWNRRN